MMVPMCPPNPSCSLEQEQSFSISSMSMAICRPAHIKLMWGQAWGGPSGMHGQERPTGGCKANDVSNVSALSCSVASYGEAMSTARQVGSQDHDRRGASSLLPLLLLHRLVSHALPNNKALTSPLRSWNHRCSGRNPEPGRLLAWENVHCCPPAKQHW